jgi:copper chaperone CopZ
MKSIKIFLAIPALLSLTYSPAQVKNAKTEAVKIYGNCGMCETTIEEAGHLKKVAEVDWDKDTKMATLVYDTIKTNREEILKRIALAGYDSEAFLAPDDAYASLPGCCQYDRGEKSNLGTSEEMEDHAVHHNGTQGATTGALPQAANQLQSVFDGYFELKDALVKSDADLASEKASGLVTAINGVDMSKLSEDEHTALMGAMKDLKTAAGDIAETTDLADQRDYFMALSGKMYALQKSAKQDTPVYYQHCPMANDGKGAHWLSKENAIKNPYYGSAMLTCGKTVETIER